MSLSCAPATTYCQKWWQTVLETKVHALNEKAQCALMRGPVYFFWSGGGGGMSLVLDIKVHAANEKAQDALMRGPIFFLLGGEGGRGGFFFSFFSLFPSCSQFVPQ
jgi:hypothetical protein